MSHIVTSRLLLRHTLESARWIYYEETPVHQFHPDPVLVASPAVNTLMIPVAPGTFVSLLSVYGGSGPYTFSLTSNPGGRYEIVGAQLQTLLSGVAGTDTIVIQADNGRGSIVAGSVIVTVISTLVPAVPGSEYPYLWT